MVVKNIICILFILTYIKANSIPSNDQPAIIEGLRDADRSSRIVGGWPALDEQIPHQVSLRIVSGVGGVSSCGGSIIHHNWVITAAHCVANRFTFVLSIGLTNLTRPDYILESTTRYIHPRYDQSLSRTQTDDIALVELHRYIPYSSTIQPVRLQSSEQKNTNYDGVTLVVSGYGRTDDPWNGGEVSEVLRWVFLRGITNEECRRWFPHTRVIQDQTVCAASYNESSQSSCHGDSGGPLTIVDYDGQRTMIGIVSFASSAGCNSRYPAGYVRPGHYHDWYYEVTGINFDWTQEDLQPIELEYDNDPVVTV